MADPDSRTPDPDATQAGPLSESLPPAAPAPAESPFEKTLAAERLAQARLAEDRLAGDRLAEDRPGEDPLAGERAADGLAGGTAEAAPAVSQDGISQDGISQDGISQDGAPSALAGDPDDAAPATGAPDPADTSLALDTPDSPAGETAERAPSGIAAPLAPPAARVIRRGPGFVPLVLGGIVAAGIGAGTALWLLPHLPPGVLPPSLQPGLPPAGAGAPGQTASTGPAPADPALVARLDALAAKVDALPPAGAEGTPDTGAAEALRGALEENRRRIEDLAARLGAVEGGDAEAAVQGQIDELRRMMEQSRDTSQAAQADIAAAAKDAADRIATAQQEADRLRAEAEAAAAAARRSAAAAQIQAAVREGAGLEAARAALEAEGVALPPALSGEVPRIEALREGFPPPARAALAEARRAAAGPGTLDRIGAFFLAQTGVRSLAPQAGEGPDALISRAEAALGQGDVRAALGQLDLLPEPARAPLAEWRAEAERYLAAEDAAAALGQTSK